MHRRQIQNRPQARELPCARCQARNEAAPCFPMHRSNIAGEAERRSATTRASTALEKFASTLKASIRPPSTNQFRKLRTDVPRKEVDDERTRDRVMVIAEANGAKEDTALRALLDTARDAFPEQEQA